MTDKDYETIFAIALEDPERIKVMIASTPTGRRGKFYNACKVNKFNQADKVKPVNTKQLGYVYDTKKYNRSEAEGWVEFHIPSMANPGWSPKMERSLKMEFSEVAYEHEVLAEFGTETIGVFNKEYVDEAASKGYAFQDKTTMNSPVAIGVDFDKFGAQSNIVVLQYDPYDRQRARPELGITEPDFGRFKVINHIEVPKSDMHYDLTVKMVQELDEKYKPFAIYPDKGSGEYQIEMLRKHLGDKVKGVSYGSSLEVEDPITGIIEKKPLKPFLVNQTALLLERGKLRIPHVDTSEIIQRQMHNFQVVKVSERTQEPTYSSTDEHGLDAMIFALYAFINDYPELVKTIDKNDPARKAFINTAKKPDPLGDMMLERVQKKGKNSDNPLVSHGKKAGLRMSKRKEPNSLGWGRRGSNSGRQIPKRRGF